MGVLAPGPGGPQGQRRARPISLIALGMLRRDGAWVLLGIATGLISIVLVWAVTLSLVSGVLGTPHRTFP